MGRAEDLTPDEEAAQWDDGGYNATGAAPDDRERFRAALQEIAGMPPVQRNPDGIDQAAQTMQLVAREALGSAT